MIERRYPRIYDGIQLSEIQTNGHDFNYIHDYSKERYEEIVIGSAPLERIVSFKSFLNSYTIKLDKESNVESEANKNFSIIHEKGSKLTITLGLDIPAMDVHEAMVNSGKIEELQRLILGSKWGANPGSPPFRTTTFRNVSQKSGITTPLFYVYYRNLVNSGRTPLPERITDFKDLMFAGFTCYIDNIQYSPVHDMGHFEQDGKLYPKALSLTLTLNYEDQTLFDEYHPLKNMKALQPFQLNGHYSYYDSGLFPFCVDSTSNDIKVRLDDVQFDKLYTDDVNDIKTPTGTISTVATPRINTYIFISNTVGYEVKKNPLLKRKPRWVVFRPFIEDFSRKVSTKIEQADNGNSSIFSKVNQTGVTFESIDYTLKFNVPSESLVEAKKNCVKVQYLMRMFLKKYDDGTKLLSRLENGNRMEVEDYISKLMFYIPSMVERPNSGPPANSGNRYHMFERAIPLYMKDLDVEFDMEAGFFTEGVRLYPKVMTISMNMLYNRNDMIRNYTVNLDNNNNNYYELPEFQTRSPIDKDEYPFFPLDKKTIKIGR